MGKFNAGTTASILGSMAVPMAQKIGQKIHNKAPQSASASSSSNTDDPGDVPQFKKGGMVKRTGLAKVHKGERVLTKKQAKKYNGRKRG